MASDLPAIEGTVEPRAGAQGGEWLGAAGPANLDSAHAPERVAQELLGKDPTIDELTPEWVISRLMREATDYGTRSRQTARVSALTVLAKASGLLDEEAPHRKEPDAVQRALDMPPEERRRMITERIQQLVKSGMVRVEDLKG